MNDREPEALSTHALVIAVILAVIASVLAFFTRLPSWPELRVDEVREPAITLAPVAGVALLLLGLLATTRFRLAAERRRTARATQRLVAVDQSAPDLVFFETDPEGRFTYVSPTAHSVLGFEPEEMVGQAIGRFSIEDPTRLLDPARRAGTVREGEWSRKDGLPIRLQAVARPSPEGDACRSFHGVLRDIGDRAAVEDALSETRRMFLDMIESAQNGILIVDSTGRILLWNSALSEMLGYAPRELARLSIGDLAAEPATGTLLSLVTARIWGAAPPGRYEKQFMRRDGSVCDVEVSISTYPMGDDVKSALIEVNDITDRKRATEQIQQLADYDHLTGLPNRQLLERAIAEMLDEAHRTGHPFAVMLIDLDRFKLVNDTLGHAVGDQLLQQVAARFVEALPEDHLVARFGGDEFLVLTPLLEDLDTAMHSAAALVGALVGPMRVGGRMLHSAASVGVALYPHDGLDAPTLIRRADAAMYKAKEMGGTGFQFAAAALEADSQQRLRVENDLREAIKRRELTVYYQPEVDAETGEIVSLEALVRWNHGKRGLLQPAEFIPILEDSGLIRLVDEWVLREALEQNRRWCDEGLGPVVVSVNQSARLFVDDTLLVTIRELLEETGIDPSLLELEVTETTALQNVAGAVAVLSELHRIGVRTALDDFGTGHSSLVRLKEFPLTTLKIDGSFVQSVNTDEDSGAIVSGVIALGHALGLTVVAEGVEHKRQLALLRALGCDLVQGYLFARPLTSEDATELLRHGLKLGEDFAA